MLNADLPMVFIRINTNALINSDIWAQPPQSSTDTSLRSSEVEVTLLDLTLLRLEALKTGRLVLRVGWAGWKAGTASCWRWREWRAVTETATCWRGGGQWGWRAGTATYWRLCLAPARAVAWSCGTACAGETRGECLIAWSGPGDRRKTWSNLKTRPRLWLQPARGRSSTTEHYSKTILI
jgi:hypothetical protein